MRRLGFAFGAVIVAIVVLAVGGIGGSLLLENQDSFCASCHTEPETKYYQQSTQPEMATLAVFHVQESESVRCIDCHSGAGPLGRAQGLQQGIDDLVIYLSGNYHNPGITSNPLGDDSCLKCHEKIGIQRAPQAGQRLPPTSGQGQPPTAGQNRDRRQTDGHYHQFLQRWQAADPRAAHCVDCHTAHNNQGPIAGHFVAQDQIQPVCNQCHTALNVRD